MKQLKEQFLTEISGTCGLYPAQVRAEQPLIHLLTNYVTVTDCVNAVLAVGGKAICSHAPQEAASVTAGSGALVLNLGGTEYYEAMLLSAQQAEKNDIPTVIDPVGCAASGFRLEMCRKLVQKYHPAAVRGNYAEIAVLTDGMITDAAAAVPVRGGSKGLDSTGMLNTAEAAQLKAHMRAYAQKYHLVLIASGETDLCTDGERLVEITAGTAALRRITGAGCLSTAVLAVFLAAERSAGESSAASAADDLDAAAAAVRYIGTAGEYALKACRKTGTGAGHFHMYFMDMLGASDPVWE